MADWLDLGNGAATIGVMKPNADEPGLELESEQRAFLDREAEHFLRSELAHEQRASWMLALASGLLIALWRLLTDRGGEIAKVSFVLLIATLATLIVAVALSLWALWPLGGGKIPGVLRPWRQGFGLDAPEHDGAIPPVPARFSGPIGPTVWRHYVYHRRRAEIKGRRVVWATLTLFAALFIGGSAMLMTLLVTP